MIETIAYPVAVGDIVIRVLEAGDGPETVVMLHGLGARADRWRRNMPALAAAGYHVYALDFPGHGFSEKSAHFPHSVPAYAELVAKFVDSVADRSRTTLVGTSMGGHVAATAALRDPGAYRGVVLVGAVGMRALGEPTRAAIAASIVDTSREGIERKMKLVIADQSLVTPEWLREEERINNSPGAAEALGAIGDYFANRVDDDALDANDLARLFDSTPCLVVWGAEDDIVPVSIADELERSHDVRVVRIPRAKHLPYYERPDEFNAELLRFLQAVGEERSIAKASH